MGAAAGAGERVLYLRPRERRGPDPRSNRGRARRPPGVDGSPLGRRSGGDRAPLPGPEPRAGGDRGSPTPRPSPASATPWLIYDSWHEFLSMLRLDPDRERTSAACTLTVTPLVRRSAHRRAVGQRRPRGGASAKGSEVQARHVPAAYKVTTTSKDHRGPSGRVRDRVHAHAATATSTASGRCASVAALRRAGRGPGARRPRAREAGERGACVRRPSTDALRDVAEVGRDTLMRRGAQHGAKGGATRDGGSG